MLGGTFDPVHRGHLHAAGAARAALGAARVTLLLAARPWHRAAPAASVAHRWRMLGLALRDQPGLARSDREVARQGPSYTVATLRELGPGAPLVWLIGSDAAAAIGQWHRAEELAGLCHLLVFDRPRNGSGVERPAPPAGFRVVERAADLAGSASGGVHHLATPMLDVSATQVRRAASAGADGGALVPARVWAYIRRHGLYGASPAG